IGLFQAARVETIAPTFIAPARDSDSYLAHCSSSQRMSDSALCVCALHAIILGAHSGFLSLVDGCHARVEFVWRLSNARSSDACGPRRKGATIAAGWNCRLGRRREPTKNNRNRALLFGGD